MSGTAFTDFPSTWEAKPIRFIFSVLNGATPSSSETAYWNGDIYWATPQDIGALEGKFIKNTQRKITSEGYENSGTQLAPIGSIVLTTRAPVGNIALAGVPLCTNQGCKTLIPKSELINTDYFFYQLLARKSELEILSTGTTFQELSTEKLRAIELWVPPLSEQRAIAAYLDRETARLDALLDALERLLGLLMEKRQALISHAVTRGLNPDIPLRDSGVAWLGEIPAHWEISRIASLFRERDERDKPDLPLLNVSIHTGVTVRELSDSRIEQMASDFSTYKVAYQNDIAFNKMRMWQGAVGKVPINGLVSPDYVVAEPVSDKIESAYYGELFRIDAFSAEAARNSHGIVWDRLRLYWSEFRDIRVPVPPFDEQYEIVDYLLHETAKLDKLSDAIRQAMELLQERRAALIAEVVSGKLKVSR